MVKARNLYFSTNNIKFLFQLREIVVAVKGFYKELIFPAEIHTTTFGHEFLALQINVFPLISSSVDLASDDHMQMSKIRHQTQTVQ